MSKPTSSGVEVLPNFQLNALKNQIG